MIITKNIFCFVSQEELCHMDVDQLQSRQQLVKHSTEMGELEAVEVLMSINNGCCRNGSVLRKELRPLTPFSDSSGEESLLPGPALFPSSPCVSEHGILLLLDTEMYNYYHATGHESIWNNLNGNILV